MLSRVWARKGTRPRILRDHRYGYVYLFSAACPETGTAVGHVCAKANTGETPSPGDRGAGSRGQARPRRPRRSGLSPVQGTGDTRQLLPAPGTALQSGTGRRRDAVLGPEASPLRQPRVRKRRACQEDRRRRVERVRPQDGRDHANHRVRAGRAVKRGPTSIRDCLSGLVSARKTAFHGVGFSVSMPASSECCEARGHHEIECHKPVSQRS